MKIKHIFTFCLLLCFSFSYSQTKPDTAYLRVISQRVSKIANTLEIKDSVKFQKVCNIIAYQYINLGIIHDNRNARIKQIKTDSTINKNSKDSLIKNLENEAFSKLYKLHFEFTSNLLTELDNRQIDKIKDEMTFNVAPRTYQGYIDMLPKLTNEQKARIYSWLIEAREFAIDAESSDKKHAWFGKYKGRINNYLSKEGYDLKKEGDDWQKRIKAKEGEKK